MSESIELEDEESQDMGSRNHSLAQARLTGLLFNDKRFSVFVELSLELSQLDMSQFDIKAKDELKPDVCIYPKGEGMGVEDTLKMQEMPLLAIEVISPKQGVGEIISKFKVYFALGVKSCWLVVPALGNVTVFSDIHNRKTFGIVRDTEVIDDILEIRLPIDGIFG
jgi:Uma2 family endonuclease